MNLTINGQKHSIDECQCIMDILLQFDLSPNKTMVEHNGTIVEKSQYNSTSLVEGDQLELLRFMGGG